ncbi:Site-specific recombinase XerD [Pseudobutyrivibrio sp. ACV-2]|uniref:tyrosine-type recombinase/integrase n=1 Tax=Pseudobutyrivibrio sp. ACV-2 TaxID=1520801 RepID=UPI0008968F58|nr:tyrosine-type recombinase/integrase [Pseudobutyrivibrio sp. ACV-2]SEB02570.1 Site-specific recombinase XerD [Pseudobutyrivibrio sp. ACV-2]
MGNNVDVLEVFKARKSLESQREFLNVQHSLGIIDADGVRNELELISKKEQAIRDRLVLNSHVTADGLPRSIAHHEPTPNNPKDYYSTKMPDGKKIKAVTYDGLMEKLFAYYTTGIRDYSIESVFNAALHEKEVTENPKANTLAKNRVDFKHYISKELASKDIRNVNDLILKQYTQEWVNREHPKQKAFFSYKGILNLIFGYAYAHKIIPTNPVEMIKNKPYMKSCDTRKAKPEDKILSPEEIDIIKDEIRYRMTKKKWGSYYINGYAALFAIETGVRVGELCALKWEDILATSIHIHAQQLSVKENGQKVYYYDTCTKNEKGISQDGREFPLTRKIKNLLLEIKDKQDALGIDSEFIFCHEDGDWIKKDAYETFLRRLCQSKGFHVTNNHALRMSLNSNVLLPMGISVADRAAMLGHSIQTNLQFYSFAKKDYLENVRDLLDSQDDSSEGTLREPLKIIPFSKKESPETLISQCF